MTEIEAISYLKETIAICDTIRDRQLNAVCALSIKALEKQIPKEPLNKSIEYNGEYGYCPCCNRILCDYRNSKRCPDCGQALKW